MEAFSFFQYYFSMDCTKSYYFVVSALCKIASWRDEGIYPWRSAVASFSLAWCSSAKPVTLLTAIVCIVTPT